MRTLGDFNELKNFFSSYFHQDWPEDAKDPMEVISVALAQGWTPEELRVLTEQIRRFIHDHQNDEELEDAVFSELGAYYQPSADKVSARKWLEDVASTLTAAAEASES